MITIQVGNKEFKVKEARTEEERKKGLQEVKELSQDEGMLFYFDPPQTASMWMKDTEIPLDIVFFNDNEIVTNIHQGIPNDEKLIEVDNTAYVLEVNINSGILIGEELEFPDYKGPIMKVLFQDGSEQYALWGGERIFRRAFTKLLINRVKLAELVKDDPEKFESLCKAIGRKMFKEIKAQDNRPAEYVESPEISKNS